MTAQSKNGLGTGNPSFLDSIPRYCHSAQTEIVQFHCCQGHSDQVGNRWKVPLSKMRPLTVSIFLKEGFVASKGQAPWYLGLTRCWRVSGRCYERDQEHPCGLGNHKGKCCLGHGHLRTGQKVGYAKAHCPLSSDCGSLLIMPGSIQPPYLLSHHKAVPEPFSAWIPPLRPNHHMYEALQLTVQVAKAVTLGIILL